MVERSWLVCIPIKPAPYVTQSGHLTLSVCLIPALSLHSESSLGVLLQLNAPCSSAGLHCCSLHAWDGDRSARHPVHFSHFKTERTAEEFILKV